MDEKTFISLISALTGTPVKGTTESDIKLLSQLLRNEERDIDRSQLNELLLLVNKDRMSAPMFDRFFGPTCSLSRLEPAIRRYQRFAMLRYGNFVFAYRTLSKITDRAEFDNELGTLCVEGDPTGSEYRERAEKLLEIESIPRNDTPLAGYLSARIVIAESERSELLQLVCRTAAPGTDWKHFEAVLKELSRPTEWEAVLGIIHKYRARTPAGSPDEFGAYLATVAPEIQQRHDRLIAVQAAAARNQDIYLTWDQMDVYFATSMRKSWEFADLYDFISGLMDSPDIDELKIRYFDPTQSYMGNRVDKGLVESLMLKRAKCTVYSVQDTDTLGKDSELAATLAQGKPVIAFVPTINEKERAAELMDEEPQTVLDRLRFVLYADDRFMAMLTQDEREFLAEFRALPDFAQTTVFRAVPEPDAVERFRQNNRTEMERLCRMIAAAERRVYDSRANSLKNLHPLAIQVNLATGVANGVMVVRTIAECSALLRRVLTDTMEFDLKEDDSMWYLQERISGSSFRVVTKNIKINNCFWNFYLRR